MDKHPATRTANACDGKLRQHDGGGLDTAVCHWRHKPLSMWALDRPQLAFGLPYCKAIHQMCGQAAWAVREGSDGGIHSHWAVRARGNDEYSTSTTSPNSTEQCRYWALLNKYSYNFKSFHYTRGWQHPRQISVLDHRCLQWRAVYQGREWRGYSIFWDQLRRSTWLQRASRAPQPKHRSSSRPVRPVHSRPF